MSADVKLIISELFGSDDRIPVFDQMAYEIPVEFWQSVLRQVQDFESFELQYTTLLRLAELSKEMRYYDQFLLECGDFLHLDIEAVEKFLQKDSETACNLTALNDHLLEFLAGSKLNLEINIIKDRRKQRLNVKKRKLTRGSYVLFEEQKTAEAYRKYRRTWNKYEEPVLMVDRIEFLVFVDKYLSYRQDVKDVLDQSKFKFFTEVERSEYTRRELLDAGYSKDEVDMYVPVNLDHHFDFIRNRSVLDGYPVIRKPRLVRDGSGWSYVWHVDGITYRFNHEPPNGRPVSLMAQANMQRLVWNEILEKEPDRDELVREYRDQFIRESNYIPLGRESLYQKYESKAFYYLVHSLHDSYIRMMERVGFDNVDRSELQTHVTQVELCWNNPMPVDIGGYLSNKYDQLRSIGLYPQLDAKTPLIHTKFFSDVDTGEVRFTHKEYRKSKKVFRSELIFGNELKNRVDILGTDRSVALGLPAKTISDQLLDNLKEGKKYLYFKVHRRYDQVCGVSGHGYYDWRNSGATIGDDFKRDILLMELGRYEDLPEWLKDITHFDVLVDQDWVDRRFFSNLTDQQYRDHVREDPLFQKMGHGRYRLIHPAVLEYRKVRDSLNSTGKFSAADFLGNSHSLSHQ